MPATVTESAATTAAPAPSREDRKAAWRAYLQVGLELQAAVKAEKTKEKRRFRDARRRAPFAPGYRTKPTRPDHRPSPYRGVSWNLRDKLWVARIKVKGRSIFLGVFLPHDAESAALAYNLAAVRHFGAHAVLNFSKDPGRVEPGTRPSQLARYWAEAPERERSAILACQQLKAEGRAASIEEVAGRTGLSPATVLVYINKFLRQEATP